MKKVFVHSVNNLWQVIDKSTGQIYDTVNDVLLFNGEYRRYKDIKGWHGILSEEINYRIIELIQTPFVKVINRPNIYYPRAINLENIPIKTAAFIRFNSDNTVCIQGFNYHLNSEDTYSYCKEWDNEGYSEEEDE